MPLNEEGFISRVAIRHSVSTDAIRTILKALRSGGGTMAQFSHADFGGMSQWSPGMTMVPARARRLFPGDGRFRGARNCVLARG
jgi:hypothetical protein